jgi:outer membrane protein
MLRYLVFLFVPMLSFGQNYTLETAIAEGLKNRIELKNQKLLIDIAKRQNLKIDAQWKPQINGAADVRWNTQLQTSILPFDITGKDPEGITKAKFGLPFNNSLGIQADQKIFDANKKIDQNINQNTVIQREYDLEKQANAVKMAISEAFYVVLLNKEQIRINQEAYDRTKTAKEAAETKFKVGTLLENDFNRFLLDENNAKILIDKSQLDLELALSTLKYLMGLSEANKVEISANLSQTLSASTSSFVMQYENRPEIKAEENTVKLNTLNIDKEMAKNRPTVSAYGNYSLLQLSKTPNPFASGTWFPFNYVGVKLNLPIFNGKQSNINAIEYKIQQEISRNTIQKFKDDFDQEAKISAKQMVQARLDLEQAQKNIKLAESIYGVDKFRYEKGVLTLADLKATEYTLKQAENNYLNAAYTFLVAELKYKKATGNL